MSLTIEITNVHSSGLRNGQGIKIYNLDGTSRPGCVIKTQDSTFFTSRHNPSVNCLAFHPLRVSNRPKALALLLM